MPIQQNKGYNRFKTGIKRNTIEFQVAKAGKLVIKLYFCRSFGRW